jgi:glutamyl-tRNA synthetase
MQFAAQGFLSVAMVNYLALLGWNDGTEDEIFSVQDLGKLSLWLS